MLDVVARQRAVARSEPGAIHVGELLGMQLDGQAQRLGGLEDLLGLGQAEGDALAEHVHRVHQAFFGQRGKHLAADQIDVVLAAAGVFRWQRMRAQEGGAHGDAAGLAQPPRGAQLLALVLQRQAVAGFDLDGAHALVQQRLKPRQGLREQFVFRSGARGFHGGDDASAGPGDLFVAGSGQPHGEFVGAVAAIDEVGVAIHKAGRGQGAPTRMAGQRGEGRRHGGHGSDPAHGAALHHDAGQGIVGHGHVRG